MGTINPTGELPFEIKRDFLFSTIMDGFYAMPSSLGMNVEQKKYWRRLLDGSKKLIGDVDTLKSVFADTEKGRQTILDSITNCHTPENKFFDAAVNKTLSPSDALLIRNRFIVLLEQEIIQFYEDAPIRQNLELTSSYFNGDAVTSEVIDDAQHYASWSMKNLFHAKYIPSKEVITNTLSTLLDEATKAHEAEPEVRIIPHEYTAERLAGLALNI